MCRDAKKFNCDSLFFGVSVEEKVQIGFPRMEFASLSFRWEQLCLFRFQMEEKFTNTSRRYGTPFTKCITFKAKASSYFHFFHVSLSRTNYSINVCARATSSWELHFLSLPPSQPCIACSKTCINEIKSFFSTAVKLIKSKAIFVGFSVFRSIEIASKKIF